MKEAQRCILYQISLLKKGLSARGDLRLGKQKKVSPLVPSGDPTADIDPLGLRQLLSRLLGVDGSSEVPVPILAVPPTCSVTWHKSRHRPALVSCS